MIDWKPIMKAIFEWSLLPFDSLDTSRCIWRDQNLPRPKYPYLTLKRDTIIREGGRDEERWTTDLAQENGKEVGIETTGARVFTLNVQAYVDEENGGHDPDCDAIAMLSKLQGSLGEIETAEAFCLVGLAVVEELPVIDLTAERNGQQVSHASMDIRMRVTFSSTKRTGYIDSAEVSSSDDCSPDAITGVSFTV